MKMVLGTEVIGRSRNAMLCACSKASPRRYCPGFISLLSRRTLKSSFNVIPNASISDCICLHLELIKFTHWFHSLFLIIFAPLLLALYLIYDKIEWGSRQWQHMAQYFCLRSRVVYIYLDLGVLCTRTLIQSRSSIHHLILKFLSSRV